MSDRPQTWHYGLVARWWAEFNRAGDDELAFYRSVIERSGQPVLDAGCGTGRMLVPLLQAGFDVDGTDLSPDMLAHCRIAVDHLGLPTCLHARAMHELDLPRRYRTIICCGTFGIGGQRAHDRAGMQRWHDLLLPGGVLAFDLEMPYGYANQWPLWLPANRSKLPEPWPETGARKRTGDCDEIELLARVVDLDPLEQRETRQMRARLWREGRLVAEEEHTYKASLYFRNEVVAMLEQAGFREIAVLGAYRDAPATPADETLVFVARKDG